MLTGQNDRANALKAIALGAHDFCTKPFEPEILTWTIDRAFRVHELQEENRRLQSMQQAPALSGIVTRDPEMQRICRTIEKVAPDVGDRADPGRIRHRQGAARARAARPVAAPSKRFVAINCAAIPENLLESELFGYEKGAFTGAAKQTIGKIETAHGGTLFLDEIGDLPVSLQAKLLRFLQERVIERVGGRQEIPVDVRIVCATHQSLKEQIVDGQLPRGSVLPAGRDRRRDSAAARAQGRCRACSPTASCAASPTEQRRRRDDAAAATRSTRSRRTRGRQRTRTRERDQARRDHGRRA